MEVKEKIKIALIRGDSLAEWEGRLYEGLGEDFLVTAFCSKKNLYNTQNLNYPVKFLRSSSDNFFIKNYHKYFKGIYKMIYGLEKELQNFNIAHTAEIFNFYTNQAVRVKRVNKKLKVINYFADNTFGRFEYNYWPFSLAPKYWRKKISSIIRENVMGVDLFTPITKYSAELLLEYGVDEKKIRIISPAILTDSDMAVENKPFKLLLDNLKSSGREIYLVVNRMVKEKGVYEVFYGWKLFLNDAVNKNKVLIFIGDGPELKNLTRMAKDFNLNNHVIFIKNLPNQQVRQLYKYAKALILGSMPNSVWQEQFGYVLAEAISNDCPVVSTYSGAIPEVVENAGLLFSPGNPLELRDCLIKLESFELYQALKDNCVKIKNKFAVENFRSNLVNIYKELCD